MCLVFIWLSHHIYENNLSLLMKSSPLRLIVVAWTIVDFTSVKAICNLKHSKQKKTFQGQAFLMQLQRLNNSYLKHRQKRALRQMRKKLVDVSACILKTSGIKLKT